MTSESQEDGRCEQVHLALGYLLGIKSALETEFGMLDAKVEGLLDRAANAAAARFVAEIIGES